MHRHVSSIYRPDYSVHVLSAAEFIAQGTPAGNIFNIANTLQRMGKVKLSECVREVALEVAQLTGTPVRYPRPKWANRRPGNDNRRPFRKAA